MSLVWLMVERGLDGEGSSIVGLALHGSLNQQAVIDIAA